MSAKRGSKAEMSRDVRRILTKHRIDMSVLEYSYAGSSVRLSGGLWRIDGSEFTVEALTYLISDLSKFGMLNTDLANWDLNGGTIRKIETEDSNNDDLEL